MLRVRPNPSRKKINKIPPGLHISFLIWTKISVSSEWWRCVISILLTIHFLHMLNSLINTIEAFEWLSGLKVNWDKSSICGSNIDHSKLSQTASGPHGKVDSLPFSYLGTPLGGNPRSLDFWPPIQEKISKKLDRRRHFQLSRGGRLTLSNAFLADIQIYYVFISNVFENLQAIWEEYQEFFLRRQF